MVALLSERWWTFAIVLPLLWTIVPGVAASDADEFKVKRAEIFEFAEKPTVTRDGDRATITFTSKGYCDVTVAIEDEGGRIVRHLASGVLGPNAPAPFQKNSLKQTLPWDSKDDQGRYLDDLDTFRVRVSLGLAPRFERTLYWTPYKRIAATDAIVLACPEGVLVYEGQVYDMVRLYDHNGGYLRTVYPFPAARLNEVADLQWAEFPQDGRRLPMKQWFRQATLLTSGTNSNHPWPGFGAMRFAHDGHGANVSNHAASAMAIHDSRIALAMLYLNRISLEGATPASLSEPQRRLPLNGPKVHFETKRGGKAWRGGNEIVQFGPTSAAFAPDGRTLYLTGCRWMIDRQAFGKWWYYAPAVLRMDYEGDAEPTVFVGGVRQSDEGDDNTHFQAPTSVAVDAQGRIYVSDYMNDRVQVYRPDGSHLRSLAVNKPARVVVHPRTGEIYVFSWSVNYWRMSGNKQTIQPRLYRFGSVDDPGKAVSFDLPVAVENRDLVAEIDCWAEEPTVWLYPGEAPYWEGSVARRWAEGRAWWRSNGPVLLRLAGDRLKLVRDFGAKAADDVPVTRRVSGTNRNLAVNPVTGELYVGDGSATEGFSWSRTVRIDPQTGRGALIELPFDTEQMVFDIGGLAYLRAKANIVRYDPRDWREVPWDYGEEHKNVGVSVTEAKGPGKKTAPKVAAAVVTPQFEHAPQGVFSISPLGRLVVPIKGKSVYEKTGVVFRQEEAPDISDAKPYQFRLYPGRATGGLVAVYDEHGQLLHDDAVPGIGFTHGVKIDRDDNLYAMVMGTRVLDGKPYFNPATDTLVKFKPGKARIIGIHKHSIPVPLTEEQSPQRPPDWVGGGKTCLLRAWAEGAEWFYGGVGYNGEHYKCPDYGCDCCYCSFDLDYFARSFVPEVEHCSVAVLDSNGNLILRIGQYGNVDDGLPLVKSGGPATARSIGGDEVALFYAPHLAVHTDHRLFVADIGNERIVCVKLEYHETTIVSLGARKSAE